MMHKLPCHVCSAAPHHAMPCHVMSMPMLMLYLGERRMACHVLHDRVVVVVVVRWRRRAIYEQEDHTSK